MSRTTRLIAISALFSALAAAPASATVLLAPPARDATANRPLYVQLWYRSFDGGPRCVTVTVSRDGNRVVHRTLAASTRWRTYTLVRHAHPGTYTTRIVGAGWRARYRTVVRRR